MPAICTSQHLPHGLILTQAVLAGQVRQKLLNTRRRMEDELAGHPPREDDEWYATTQELVKPLLACYWSLWQCGAGVLSCCFVSSCCNRYTG